MLTPVFELAVDVGVPQSVGRDAAGERRCVPITGGAVSGKISGVVLSGGADWQVLRPMALPTWMRATCSGSRVARRSRCGAAGCASARPR